jgi:hypothetical protein
MKTRATFCFFCGASVLLSLLILVSCKTKEPSLSCSDGTCCNPDASEYGFIQNVENEPGDLFVTSSETGVVFQRGLPDNWKIPTRAFRICALSADKVRLLPDTYRDGLDSLGRTPGKYRVWGKLYKPSYWNSNFTGAPILFIYIDRIEKAK